MGDARECKTDKKLKELTELIKEYNVSGSKLSQYTSIQNFKPCSKSGSQEGIIGRLKFLFIISCLPSVAIWSVCLLKWNIPKEYMVRLWFDLFEQNYSEHPCILDGFPVLEDLSKPLRNCDMCRGVTKINRIANISLEEFNRKYGFTGVPVVITDGAKNWTALDVFSFEFFKTIYPSNSPGLENVVAECREFNTFGYEFENLGSVLSMAEERYLMKNGTEPWYIGWANCDQSVTKILRQHYTRPYFLPPGTEIAKVDWIFMGSPGHGAMLHIDNVYAPTWQAQIKGSKHWTLVPPSECYFSCPKQVSVTLHAGEIFAVDTDKWYHATQVVSDTISIAIGCEYD